MANRHLLAVALLASATSLTPPMSHAASIDRFSYVMAAGVCQPFVPTSQVRYNAAGISNVGTSLIYVVCSMAGSARNSENAIEDGNAHQIHLTASNATGTPQSITCSARPGLAAGSQTAQLSSTKVRSLPPGGFETLAWAKGEFAVAGLANANFTCALNPGVSINYVDVSYIEMF